MSGPTANLALMGSLAQAQSAPTGHFDRGGSVSQTKGKVTLTPQEAEFCRRLKIPYAAFARHKAGPAPLTNAPSRGPSRCQRAIRQK
jgi:hypothetical protein